MKRIIIDTNFLLVPFKYRVDIFSEFSRICDFTYGLFIFGQSIEELGRIVQSQSGMDKKAAQFALKLVNLKNIGIINSPARDVDSLILADLDKDTIVATQDLQLKKKLLAKSTTIIVLRQKKYLQLIKKAL
ncbi:hypothetical protein HYX08_05825 [Candidatus Woesearchaeota archaeon]|nr:hypothetical protein [Candidatus Woesearchaeota archaeon]